jgi:hypothetical protein
MGLVTAALPVTTPLARKNSPAARRVDSAILSMLLLVNLVFMCFSLGSVVGDSLLMTELYGCGQELSIGLRPNAENGV